MNHGHHMTRSEREKRSERKRKMDGRNMTAKKRNGGSTVAKRSGGTMNPRRATVTVRFPIFVTESILGTTTNQIAKERGVARETMMY